MSTGTEIVENAYGMIGVHSLASPADPEAIAKGFKRLDKMLQTWLSLGIDLGHCPITTAGEEIGEPPDATIAIEENLAIKSAPFFDNGRVIVSKDLKDNARNSYDEVYRLFWRGSIPTKVISSTVPMGEGNSQGQWSRTFFRRGTKLKN